MNRVLNLSVVFLFLFFVRNGYAQIDTLIGIVNGELIKIHLADAGVSDELIITDFPTEYDPYRLTWCEESNCYFGLARNAPPSYQTAIVRITADGVYSELGVVTIPGETVYFLESISWNRFDKKLYVSGSLNGEPPSDYASESLVRVDTTTLVGEIVGEFFDLDPDESDADQFTFDDAGTLYYMDGQPGGGGFLRIFEQDIDFAFDPILIYSSGYYVTSDLTVRDDIMYFSSNRELRQIDLATDTYSVVGTMFTTLDYEGVLMRGLTWRSLCVPDDPNFEYSATTFCISEPLVSPILVVTLGGEFTASPAGLVIDPITGEIDPALSAVGTYEVTYALEDECPIDSSLTITIVSIPTVDPIVDFTLCANALFDGVLFTGTLGAVFNWSCDNPAIGIGVSGEGDISAYTTPTLLVEESAIITVTPTLGDCIGDPISFEIRILPVSPVDIVGDVLIGCEGLTVNFNNIPADLVGSCYWEFGDGSFSSSCGPVFHTYNSAGEFDVRFTFTDLNGCVSEIFYADYITITPRAIASFTASSSVLSDPTELIHFTNTSEFSTSYEWNFGDGSALNNETHPSHSYLKGNYEVRLVAFGSDVACNDTAYLNIETIEEVIFYVPNTFTPDGDDHNNIFYPVIASGIDPYDYHLEIYNRWGETVFESYDYSVGWDGSYGSSGALVQDGVYVWVITFGEVPENDSDERHTVQGHVLILR